MARRRLWRARKRPECGAQGEGKEKTASQQGWRGQIPQNLEVKAGGLGFMSQSNLVGFMYLTDQCGCYVENDCMRHEQQWEWGHQLGGCGCHHVREDGGRWWQRKASERDRSKIHWDVEPKLSPFHSHCLLFSKGGTMPSGGCILAVDNTWLFSLDLQLFITTKCCSAHTACHFVSCSASVSVNDLEWVEVTWHLSQPCG